MQETYIRIFVYLFLALVCWIGGYSTGFIKGRLFELKRMINENKN